MRDKVSSGEALSYYNFLKFWVLILNWLVKILLPNIIGKATLL